MRVDLDKPRGISTRPYLAAISARPSRLAFVYLVAGRMLYEVDGIAYELAAGDTLHFDARRPHRGENIGRETAIELWVGTMRLFPE